MIFLGILIALLGLAFIFARDFMWGLTVMSNQMKGRTSERTDLWDTGQVFSGVVCLLVGVGLICAQISESSADAAKAESATATAASLQAALDEAFGLYLSEWQKAERITTYSVRPRDVQVRANTIYYGRCVGNHFYLFVMGFNGQYDNYAYVPDADPERCLPEGMSMYYTGDLGGGWYKVNGYGTPSAVTRVAPTTQP